ncbi:MAG TPA: GNAT family N-acetyltransferase [Brevundimonas sp.]|jgi:ribosomal protein S18 acetylase RimI-like enzyme|uniref:GNAT family N-acetyltransferase n=1 Tax=Brevundimonas sp. TaxID=1871086 RepID=UPI002DE9B98C|nr:GNAT family N-acetyltransferase [Brevundimonas sp.]
MTLPAGYDLAYETPAVDEHVRLRTDAGMTPMAAENAGRGLPNTLVGVVVRHDGRAIGMGRAIGDGGLFAQIVDVAVDPAHQGKGLGKAIMAALMSRLAELAAPGCYVSLIADGEAWKLYEQYGFRPTAPRSIGMARLL